MNVVIEVCMLANDKKHEEEARKTLGSIPVRVKYDAKSMASGYNELARESKADILCFMHQDCRIGFDAATIIPQYFARLTGDERPGVIGLCGTARLEPHKWWWDCSAKYGGLTWGDKPLAFDPCLGEFVDVHGGTGPLRYTPVETLDGYCLFIKRSVFEEIGGFDETFDNWHGYDQDLCLAALAKGHQNYVIDQPTTHLGNSAGGHDEKEKSTALLHLGLKWRVFLQKRHGVKERHICVYTICKNEAQFVERFMRTTEGASGVYVLDTGSTDNTVELLRRFGAVVQVTPFKPWKTMDEYRAIVAKGERPWRFDTSRNLNIDMMPQECEIAFSVDLDEVITPGWRQVIEQNWVPGTTNLYYQYAWSMAGDKPDRQFPYHKIHGRHDYVWQCACHEELSPRKGVVHREAWCNDLLVKHYPDNSKPRACYLPLLQLAAEDDATDVRAQYYYGRELTFYSRWPEGIAQLTKYLNMPNATWPFERAHAAELIALAYKHLSFDTSLPEEKRNNHKREYLRWSMRAVYEEINQREPWLVLADCLYAEGSHPGTYWAAKQALAIKDAPRCHLNNPEAWSWKPHDMIGVSAWYVGEKEESLRESWAALEASPYDGRFVSNAQLVQSLLHKESEPSDKPVADVIILSYAKTKVEQDLTRNCIASLRRSSPDVPVNVIVVETNADMAKEADPFGKNVKLVCPGRRFGFNDFLNEGYAHCSRTAQYILMLNNDIALFSQDFLPEMIKALQLVVSVSPWGVREATWNKLDPAIPLHANYDVNKSLNGWAIMFDKAILGALPFEALFPRRIRWYGGDIHYGEMLRSRGHRHALVTAAKALHLQMQSHKLLSADDDPPANRLEMLKRLGLKDKLCVEVGVAYGDFAKEIMARQPQHLWLVDPWRHQPEDVYPQDGNNLSDAKFEETYQSVKKTFKADNVSVVRDYSTPFAATIADVHLDFVYIDTIYTAEQCGSDLRAWHPKLRSGGWLCGHDYQAPGVRAAVSAFLDEHPELRLDFVTREPISSWGIRIR